jgi:hypothetical protein
MANPPPYAILSHTWEDSEVTFHDFTYPDRAVTSTKKGFAKIQHTCQQAQHTGIAYAWVDTCCVDKSSSAELTEAINSMFAWYAGADVCYALLSDLDPLDTVDGPERTPNFAACRWFTRGWTLQELIAPKVVEFYDSEWTQRDTKASLSKELEAVTGIDGQVLLDSAILADIPVARRMSWAAKRRTTRVEDIAYCLLGIFDVSMPMLYGEGEKAFTRLQEEIIKGTNDLTLFAWQAKAPELSNSGDSSNGQRYRGILATSPAEFLNASAIVAGDDARFNEEFLMTNKGLRINTSLGCYPNGSYTLKLNCSLHGNATKQIGIYLTLHGAGVYARKHPEKLVLQSQWELGKADTIYISKRLTMPQCALIDKGHCNAFFIRSGLDGPLFKGGWTNPPNLWDSQRRLFLTHGMASFTGCILFSPQKQNIKQVGVSPILFVCGITEGKEQEESRPWVAIGDSPTQLALFRAIKDLKQLGELGRRIESKSIIVGNSIVASVEMEEAVVSGELMYCVDLKFEYLTERSSQGESNAAMLIRR